MIFATFLLTFLQTFRLILLIYVIASWFIPPTNSIMFTVRQMLEPLLSPIRRILPDTGPIDFSVMALFFLVLLLESLIAPFAR